MTSVADEQSLMSAVRELARHVDSSLLGRLADRVLQLEPSASDAARAEALASAVPGEVRTFVERLVRAWRRAPHVSPQAIGWALRSADEMDHFHRTASTTELIWTGPLGPGSSLRRTDQALLEVIERAQQRLLVVSFAVYRHPVLEAALLAAVARGVDVRFVFESRDDSRGKFDGNPVAALAPELRDGCRFLSWPFAQREATVTAGGQQVWGLLHAKCALADRHLLFISSANLTGAAMTLNMELGVLIEGGALPRQLGAHFDELVQHGVLASSYR